jgi:hypothetical protein
MVGTWGLEPQTSTVSRLAQPVPRTTSAFRLILLSPCKYAERASVTGWNHGPKDWPSWRITSECAWAVVNSELSPRKIRRAVQWTTIRSESRVANRKKLRKALEDSPQNPKFIETVPKVGYRFLAPVEWATETGNNHPARNDVPDETASQAESAR